MSDSEKTTLDKLMMYYQIMNMWLYLKMHNQSIIPYMKENGYIHIAIYGMKELGERLFDELDGTGIEVDYVIDKDTISGNYKLYSPEDDLPEVDCIVVAFQIPVCLIVFLPGRQFLFPPPFVSISFFGPGRCASVMTWSTSDRENAVSLDVVDLSAHQVDYGVRYHLHLAAIPFAGLILLQSVKVLMIPVYP